MLTGNLSPIFNSDDWIDAFELRDEETGETIDITDAQEIVVKIRARESGGDLLTAALSSGGVTHVQSGVFQWSFPAAQIAALRAGDIYDVLARITKDGVTQTLMIGSLPVLQG